MVTLEFGDTPHFLEPGRWKHIHDIYYGSMDIKDCNDLYGANKILNTSKWTDDGLLFSTRGVTLKRRKRPSSALISLRSVGLGNVTCTSLNREADKSLHGRVTSHSQPYDLLVTFHLLLKAR